MTPLAGFIFSGYPDGPAALDRAFVFADTAADAMGRVHIGQLQPHQQLLEQHLLQRHLPLKRRKKKLQRQTHLLMKEKRLKLS